MAALVARLPQVAGNGGGCNDRLLGGGGFDIIDGRVNSTAGHGDFCVEGEDVKRCEFDFIA